MMIARHEKRFSNIVVCLLIAAVAAVGVFSVKNQVSTVRPAPFTEMAGAMGPVTSYDVGSRLFGGLVATVAGRPEMTSAATSAATDESTGSGNDQGQAVMKDALNGKSGGGSGSDNGERGKSGDGKEKGEGAANDESVPAENTVDEDYFDTSIINGATVYEREYRFTVTHKRPELNVRGIIVAVNADALPQWNGRIELEEGVNAIRVTVRYADKTGRDISVYRDYALNAVLGDIAIASSLAELDGATVYDPVLTFTAAASYGERQLPLTVTCDGAPAAAAAGGYKAELKEGVNAVALSASFGKKSKSVTYKITYAQPEALRITTSLKSDSSSDPQVVNDAELSFEAAAGGGAGKAKLSVVFDGVTLKGAGGRYKATIGKLNRTVAVRMKATESVNGETLTLTKLYYVKYVPLATQETAPSLKYINATEGMTVEGKKFTLDIAPVDYKGQALGYNNVSVSLNDRIVKMSWMSEYLSYALTLKNGVNTLGVRVTDDEGRYADYSYSINCNQREEGESLGSVTISMDATVLGLGYLIKPVERELFEGETGAQVIDRLLTDKGFAYEHTGTLTSDFYLARVVKSGVGKGVAIPADLLEALVEDGYEMNGNSSDDSIGETDYFKGSGWMYCKNGSFPGHGFADAVLKDGDEVKIRFTLAYGKDIGGGKAAGGASGNYDKVW
jgi:hypothetical protein